MLLALFFARERSNLSMLLCQVLLRHSRHHWLTRAIKSPRTSHVTGDKCLQPKVWTDLSTVSNIFPCSIYLNYHILAQYYPCPSSTYHSNKWQSWTVCKYPKFCFYWLQTDEAEPSMSLDVMSNSFTVERQYGIFMQHCSKTWHLTPLTNSQCNY